MNTSISIALIAVEHGETPSDYRKNFGKTA